jgi:hypothetical protein
MMGQKMTGSTRKQFINHLFICGILYWRIISGVGAENITDVVDVLIGGGSLSALAAALTIANISVANDLDINVVLLEPTNWPGGQLTSSNVPVDFGTANFSPENLPQSFVKLLMDVSGPNWNTNPGMCWVSHKCFEASRASDYIKNWLEIYSPKLKVYYNTVIKSVELNDEGTRISSVQAIRRTPLSSESGPSSNSGYVNNLSTDLPDWYSSDNSTQFSKDIFTFKDLKVVIEGTELGDIVVNCRNVPLSQGVEIPDEQAESTDTTCGQSSVLPFVMQYVEDVDEITTSLGEGSDGGKPFSMDSLSWNQVWSYRRVVASPLENDDDTCYESIYQGEQSNQNLDNDYTLGYIFNSSFMEESTSGWNGGINLTVLAAAEQRSYAYFHYLIQQQTDAAVANLLTVNLTQVGTDHGLSKFPYLRDNRRLKRGLNGFRLVYADLNFSNPLDSGATARPFYDTVAIGDYFYADIHALSPGVCASGAVYPDYITCCEHPVLPYYIPFRAMASSEIVNILVPGKSMAQSFLANAATRLHPTEWSTGVAAGAAAYLMFVHYDQWVDGSSDVLKNIHELQELLRGPSVSAPLTWTL